MTRRRRLKQQQVSYLSLCMGMMDADSMLEVMHALCNPRSGSSSIIHVSTLIPVMLVLHSPHLTMSHYSSIEYLMCAYCIHNTEHVRVPQKGQHAFCFQYHTFINHITVADSCRRFSPSPCNMYVNPIWFSWQVHTYIFYASNLTS
jgi:hypothetical protein